MSVLEPKEPALTEALVPILAVEALDVAVLDGLAGSDEVEPDPPSVGRETGGSGTRYGYQNARSRPFNAPGLRALYALHALPHQLRLRLEVPASSRTDETIRPGI